MKLSRIILPLLVTSFCVGLNSCTDDSKTSTPVVGGSAIEHVNNITFERYFYIDFRKVFGTDDSTNEYKYYFIVHAKNNNIKAHKEITASILVTFHYKLEEDVGTNTAHSVEQYVDIKIRQYGSAAQSSTHTATFDRPINEYPYFSETHRIVAASGMVIIS